MSQPEFAALVGVEKSTVSNWEAGDTKLPEGRTETVDQVLGTHGHFTWLRRLADTMHDPNWFAQYTRYERKADEVSAYSALVVHALLQTEDYARALITGAQMVDDIERAVEERLARQEILNRDQPPELRVFIKQSALEDPVGGTEVMRAQLAYLLDASERRNIVIRVVPREVGAHPGVDGSFTLLDLPNGSYAWSEAVGGGRLVSDPAKVREQRLRYDRIGADALSRGPARSLIVQVMEAMK
jgi:transcriptional regulator with XRE-family HTH domain